MFPKLESKYKFSMVHSEDGKYLYDVALTSVDIATLDDLCNMFLDFARVCGYQLDVEPRTDDLKCSSENTDDLKVRLPNEHQPL